MRARWSSTSGSTRSIGDCWGTRSPRWVLLLGWRRHTDLHTTSTRASGHSGSSCPFSYSFFTHNSLTKSLIGHWPSVFPDVYSDHPFVFKWSRHCKLPPNGGIYVSPPRESTEHDPTWLTNARYPRRPGARFGGRLVWRLFKHYPAPRWWQLDWEVSCMLYRLDDRFYWSSSIILQCPVGMGLVHININNALQMAPALDFPGICTMFFPHGG